MLRNQLFSVGIKTCQAKRFSVDIYFPYYHKNKGDPSFARELKPRK